jgi:hypothetical protein
MAYFMYPPLVGGMATQEGFDRIEAACKEGGTSIHIAGASPGYVHDWVPLALTKASRSIERIELSEVVSLRGLPKRQILCDYMGFGLPVDYDPLFFRQLAVVNDNPYHLPLRMLADHTRLELDNVTWEREVALAPSEFETAAGSFPAGGMAATRGVLTGWWRERPAITMTFVWRLSHEVAPEWPVEDSWTVKIVGDPTIEADLKVTTAFGTGRPVSIVSATVPLNAVPRRVRGNRPRHKDPPSTCPSMAAATGRDGDPAVPPLPERGRTALTGRVVSDSTRCSCAGSPRIPTSTRSSLRLALLVGLRNDVRNWSGPTGLVDGDQPQIAGDYSPELPVLDPLGVDRDDYSHRGTSHVHNLCPDGEDIADVGRRVEDDPLDRCGGAPTFAVPHTRDTADPGRPAGGARPREWFPTGWRRRRLSPPRSR